MATDVRHRSSMESKRKGQPCKEEIHNKDFLHKKQFSAKGSPGCFMCMLYERGRGVGGITVSDVDLCNRREVVRMRLI